MKNDAVTLTKQVQVLEKWVNELRARETESTNELERTREKLRAANGATEGEKVAAGELQETMTNLKAKLRGARSECQEREEELHEL